MRFRVSVVALLGFGVVALAAEDAVAFENQWRVGGGVGLGGLSTSKGRFWGPLVGAHGAYGLSDMFDVLVELDASTHVLVEGSRSFVYSASGGLAYKLDVLEWIPYAGLLFGYYRTGGPSPFDSRDQLGGGAALGIDYAPGHDFAVGAQLRYHGFAGELPESVQGQDGSYLTFLLRAEHRWGF